MKAEQPGTHPPGREPKRAKPPASIPRLRLWLFRIAAALVIPVLALSALEGLLRVFGYGYPTSFFLPMRIGGVDFHVPNEMFGRRFFPATIARTPGPVRMAANKSTNSYRIFLFGESAAQGDPDPSFGFGRYLEVLLRERFPGIDFEVICVAMTAINSHAILPIARECARHDGDLWILYMGNNEMVGPFGAGTVFGPQAARLSVIRASLAAKSLRLGQLMDSLLSASSKSAPDAWAGLQMFERHQLGFQDPKRLRAYENFRENLDDMLRAARKAGVPVVVSSVASNLKDCAPFASLHRSDLPETSKLEWERNVREGIELQASENFPAALARYNQAAELDGKYAELQFRLGECHLAMTNVDLARKCFEYARDWDALAFRADGRINGILSESAKKHEANGVHFVDAQAALNAISNRDIAGHEGFYEHVHLNFAGNYTLARCFAEKIAGLLPQSIMARRKTDWASAEWCDNRLAVSPWDRHRLWQLNFSRVSEPPFTKQLNDVPRARMYMATLDQLQLQMNPEAQERAFAMYQGAVSASPDDHLLRGNFSQFLDSIGEVERAIEEQRTVHKLLPHLAGPLHKTGLLLVRQGNTDAAREHFSRALKLRPDYVPALNELGLLLAHQQRTGEALLCFTNAIRMNPGYIEAYINLGFTQQSQTNLETALMWYRQAAQRQSQGPVAFFTRGIELAMSRKRNEAMQAFGVAVKMQPGFWQARYLFGVELAAADQLEEARVQFTEVVRQRPDFAKARVNLGVALARQGKLDDALEQFRAASKLNPSNKLAEQHAQKVLEMKSRAP